MAFLIFLLILLVPVIEISVFIKVGGAIGVGATVGIIVLTAIAGTWLLRRQGISTLFKIRETLDANRMPVRELFDGVCLIAAGVLLLTPGFVTDAVGFLLFIPPLRAVLADYVAARFLANAEVRYTQTRYGPGPGGPRGPGGQGPVIDGEFTDVTPGGADNEDGKPRGRIPDERDTK